MIASLQRRITSSDWRGLRRGAGTAAYVNRGEIHTFLARELLLVVVLVVAGVVCALRFSIGLDRFAPRLKGNPVPFFSFFSFLSPPPAPPPGFCMRAGPALCGAALYEHPNGAVLDAAYLLFCVRKRTSPPPRFEATACPSVRCASN